MSKLLTLSQLADLLHLSETTVRRYVERGLPALQAGKGTPLRFDPKEVSEWLARNKTGEPDPP